MAQDATNDAASRTLDAPIACARASMLAATDRALALAAGGDRRLAPKASVVEELVVKWNRVLNEHSAQGGGAVSGGAAASLSMGFGASLQHLGQPAELDQRPPRMKFE